MINIKLQTSTQKDHPACLGGLFAVFAADIIILLYSPNYNPSNTEPASGSTEPTTLNLSPRSKPWLGVC